MRVKRKTRWSTDHILEGNRQTRGHQPQESAEITESGNPDPTNNNNPQTHRCIGRDLSRSVANSDVFSLSNRDPDDQPADEQQGDHENQGNEQAVLSVRAQPER